MNFHYNSRKTEYEYKKLKEQAFYILSTCCQSHREMMDTIRSAVPYCTIKKSVHVVSKYYKSVLGFSMLYQNFRQIDR